MSHNSPYRRVILIVLDSLGAGAMPDADRFGDAGASTLGHIAERTKLNIPHLQKMGIGNLLPLANVPPATKPTASFGRAAELSLGKDTTTGHWEMAGIHVQKPFPTYYHGYPQSFIDDFVRESGVPGILGNIAASGTEIIQTLGDEHCRTGKPIVYTSADSVFQIACHEETFTLDRLYKICEVARKLCDHFGIARVIARPFVGSNGKYSRTKNRKDFSIELPSETAMDLLQRQGIETVSIGKVASIYSERGFSSKVKAGDNRAIFSALVEQTSRDFSGLIFGNLVDFDMLYGHRRDYHGYAKELEWFDAELPKLQAAMKPTDLLLLSADHGNDPTFPGSDHTREYIPILAWSQAIANRGGNDLGIRSTFADIGQTILDALDSKETNRLGKSFLQEL